MSLDAIVDQRKKERATKAKKKGGNKDKNLKGSSKPAAAKLKEALAKGG